VATPNYSYEKRQRELAKKRKKEEKAARKSSGPQHPGNESGDAPAEGRGNDTPPGETPSAG
jgi:hypothetical protein